MPTLHKLIKNISERTWAERAYLLMYFGFCFYILFFPIGRAFREIGAVICTCGLFFYYVLDYKNSNLSRFPLKWLFFIFWGYLFFKVFHSINSTESWYVFQTGFRKGFIFFFVGLECVQGIKDIKRFTILFCIMGFYEGMDGIYQYITGQDIFRGLSSWGTRLTGSFSTPRVGNLMSLVLPVTMGIFFIWERSKPLRLKYLITTLLLLPSLFLLVGAQARSGYIGCLLACISIILFFRGMTWSKAVVLFILIAMAILLGPHRISYENAVSDARIVYLWPATLQVFLHAPFLGVGHANFLGSAISMGLTTPWPEPWPHPHNIYLQLLCETGIVGLGLFLAWTLSCLWWSLKRIRSGWLNTSDNPYWAITFCFWSSYLGYLGTAISAHCFFRDWWLGLSLSILGIIIGACIALPSEEKKGAK